MARAASTGAAARVLCAAITLGTAGCARPAVALPAPPGQASPFPKEVLAFYYGWYGTPQTSGAWIHWSEVNAEARRIGNATHYPSLGAYDSHDPQLVDRQCRWAREAGITGFIVSWWRQGDFQDQGLPLVLATARKHGLRVSVYFEEVRPEDTTVAGAAADLLYILERYARHPAWLTVDGRPVIFVYGRAVSQLTLADWRSVIAIINARYPGGALFVGDSLSPRTARVFDAIHTYNPTEATAGKSVDEIRAWARTSFSTWIAAAGEGIASITLLPGYDDRMLGRPPPRPTTDRHGGVTYRVLWEEAIAANPDWILICSWNEWHEGSEIEPSVQHDRRELETTAEFAPRFLTAPRRAVAR